MERLKTKKTVTAVLFVMILFLYAIINGKKEIPIVADMISEQDAHMSMADRISQIDTAITENAIGRYGFIDVYGYIQRVLGKNEESNFEVVKDTEGKMHYTYDATQPQDVTEICGRMKYLADVVGDEDTEVIYVMPPDKYIRGYTQFPTGIPYHMANETADVFLEKMDEYGISNMDLRDYLSESGIEMKDVFYTTDHHWKIETAFWAAGQFCEWLNAVYGEELDPDGFYADKENYNFVTYEDIMLGSMGRKTGRYYAGVDDFTLIYPKFATSYNFENTIEEGIVFSGRFEEALLATPVIRQSVTPFDTDMYMTYLYGNPAFAHIENLKETDSIDVCIIKDSFAVPFAAFVSLRCHNLDMIDPRYFEGSYEETIAEGEYDYVIVMVAPQDLVEEFFPFGEVRATE